jgi:hypothetical protein
MKFGITSAKSSANQRGSKWLNIAALSTFSLLYGFSLLLPVRHWAAVKVDLSKSFPNIPFQDSGYYLGQIEGFRSGLRNFGNPFYFEHTKDGFGNGSSALFAFWGFLGRILNLDILQNYLLMTVFSGALTVFCVSLFLRTLQIETKWVGPISFAIVFTMCGTELGRPSPTQLGLWIVFLLLWLQKQVVVVPSRHKVRVVLYVAVLVFLTFSNPFYALFVGVNHLLVLSVLQRCNLTKIVQSVWPLLLAFFPFGLTYLKRNEFEGPQSERFGVIHSHFPGAFKLTFLLCGIIAAFYFLNKARDGISQWIIIVLISNLVTLNSQVLTGVHYEMESHLNLLTKILLLCAGLYLVSFEPLKFVTYGILFALFISTYNQENYLNLFKERTVPISANELTLLKSVAEQTKVGDVLLYEDSKFPIESQEMISLLTSTYLYFTPAGNLSRTDNQEILSRLACGFFGDHSKLEVGLSQVYINRFENERLMFGKWDRILTYIGLDFYDPNSELKQKQSDFQYVIEYQKTNCANPKYFKFKLDFYVDSSGKLMRVDNA